MKESSTNKKSKEIAVSFLELVARGNVKEAFLTYISPDFKHHNPFIKGDAESLKESMQESISLYPKKIFKIHKIIHEGEFVVVHSRVRLFPEDIGFVVVYILRVEAGKIIEFWDVSFKLPEESPNSNGVI